MAFKERLKIITGEISPREIAQRAGISESGIRKWLKGETEPALGNLVALAQLAEVNVEWLATGDGPMRKGERADVESPSLLEKLNRLQRRGGAGQDVSPPLSQPEFQEPIGRLAERYGLAEEKLARVISDL
ncbi:MAG: helix-turn-helix domain-containing protein, partial [Nitrospinota bacterium]|nr:helix-turn-helix domain-containing protein [Nitrospinota bacterium]